MVSPQEHVRTRSVGYSKALCRQASMNAAVSEPSVDLNRA
jgi:hypothetical protein